MAFEIPSVNEKAETQLPKVVITQPGILLLIISMIISIFGILTESPIFIIPGLLLPITFLIFVIRILTTELQDIDVSVSFPSTQIKAKQFLAIHVKISNETELTGLIKLNVSDGLFPVVSTQISLMTTGVSKGSSFLFYAPRRGKESVKSIKYFYYGILSLFYLEKQVDLNQDITVLPQAQRITLPWNQKQQILDRLTTEITVMRKGRGNEFLSLRDFIHGDDVRFIHWKASAKYNKIIVKEFEEPVSLRFLVVLDASLFMAGPKLEFALSSAIELAEVLQRSDHSANILVHGDNFDKLLNIGNSITAIQKLALDLHSIRPEGTEFNYFTLQQFIKTNKLMGSVIILITDVEQDIPVISQGIGLLKPYYQALFFHACSTTGFGTLALSHVRDFNFYNLDQLYYRREIIEPKLKRIYNDRIDDYKQIVNARGSQFQLIESYNTNILLELNKAITLLSNRKRRNTNA
ncbi:MAG: hypothetical protein HeimC2_44990 [Candidatus Heimdallarchaeota archaeon LC_2]|nr:MAG: hypothetical protein HeimC2_44990 [Candidatus Heimdallarchaeota archaeon LC_2]